MRPQSPAATLVWRTFALLRLCYFASAEKKGIKLASYAGVGWARAMAVKGRQSGKL